MCAVLKRKNKMSKILSTLIAGLFAVSAFAADAPKAATPDTKPTVEAKAPATTGAKAAPKHHKHHKHHKANKAAKEAVPAAPAAK
jgi:hypothetical protein